MREKIQDWIEESDSLAEFVEIAEENDIPEDEQASHLIQSKWDREVPLDRATAILETERDQVDSHQKVSFSEESRDPRYMDLSDLELVSGHEFEYILGEILSRLGGEATVTEGSGDQGVDVVWFREKETVGIQAKAYGVSNPVGNSAVQEIHTGATVRDSEYSIDVPAVVTTSTYTKSAREAAESSGVKLFGRSDLEEWLSKVELDAETMGDVLEEA